MSYGDHLQNRHDVIGALSVRLTTAKVSPTDWQNLHQLGVLYSELAESARRIARRGWKVQMYYLLMEAKKYFVAAQALVVDGSREYLAIEIDRIVAHCRHIAATSRQYSRVNGPHDAMHDVVTSLRNKGGSTHLLGIALGWEARLWWGRALGFVGDPNPETATRCFNEAIRDGFGAEADNSPGNERAYRSLLLATVLATTPTSGFRKRFAIARAAKQSARRYGDRRHYRRAVAIQYFGNWGEKQLRRSRDGATLRSLGRP